MGQMEKSTAQAIEDTIKELIDQIAPDVCYVEKYGGEVIVPNPDDEKRFIGGIFNYKDHVSLEFTEGASFDDPNGYLIGNGKFRRHLKLTNAEEVHSKDALGFLKQSLAD